jgi:membrane protease subunit HflC
MQKLLIPVAILAVLIATTCFYTVKETEWAVLFKLGEIKRSDSEPGLKMKLPFINRVVKFDNRVLTVDAKPQRFLTGEKKDVDVDSYVKWQIIDPARFYISTGGDVRRAEQLIYQKVDASLRREFGNRTVKEVVSAERGTIMGVVTKSANDETQALGIGIVDVRLQRVNLPEKVSDSVYDRMRSERERVARDLRSRGKEAAERIRASADRERTEILAGAYREAEILRGKGDAMATETYAKAFGKDEDFYSFYRRMSAYQNSFSNQGDVLLLEPDSDFFRFFKNPDLQAEQPAPRY